MRHDVLQVLTATWRLVATGVCALSFARMPAWAEQPAPPAPDTAALAALWRRGDLNAFVQTAKRDGAARPDNALLAPWRVEALLSLSANDEAEQAALSALEALATRSDDYPALTGDSRRRLAKLWLAARLRRSDPLDDSRLERLLEQPATAEAFATVDYWRREPGVRPCRWMGPDSAATLARAPVTRADDNANAAEQDDEIAAEQGGRSAAERGRAATFAFAIEVNGARLANAFVDTGAQYTILSRAAAAAAGIELGPQPQAPPSPMAPSPMAPSPMAPSPMAPSQIMVGFATFSARPAVVRRLRFGGLTLADVPVLVADSPALLKAGGQASLGIDVLHHLRITLDYPAGRIVVRDALYAGTPESDIAARAAPAGSATADPSSADRPTWDIPLWTFSFAALAQGTLPDGACARTLIDTGNRSGTFVAAAWAKEHASQSHLHGGAPRVAFQRRSIESWRLGDHDLGPWPVQGLLPPALERLGVLDVLVGHDLLADYCVEIDLAGRRLRLTGPYKSAAKSAADGRAADSAGAIGGHN